MRWVSATVLGFAACAASPGAETAAAGQAPKSPASKRSTASTPASPSGQAQRPRERTETGGKKTAHGETATKGADEGPTACRSGMKLVEGEYCTKVEQKCLRSWFDESNKKTVCEEFEPHTECVGKRVKKRYCIDAYEWPNVKGERPEVMNNFYQAQVKCAAVGKRMCTESEWTFACEGPEMKPFPYGYVRDPGKCNGDRPWDGPNMQKVAQRDPDELARLWQGVRSGSQPQCISDFGVADLPGNADEVVSNETLTNDWHGKFSSVNTGGPWYKGVRNQCRPKIYTHEEGFYYYYLSFRCCANPDGQPNDPRTPKQIKEKKSFDFVERLARFTVAQMKEKLELKKEDKCTCRPSDILCKTMCGTLLGSGAKDVTLTPMTPAAPAK